MKSLLNKIFLFVILFLIAFVGHVQNKTIDSLFRILQTLKEDTSKVNTLNELA
jgi:hypothetical protein